MMFWVGHELGGQTRSSNQEKAVGGSAICASCAPALVGITISGWGRGLSMVMLRGRDTSMHILGTLKC